MPNKPIDSRPFRERDAPLPFWFANWRLKDGKEDAATAAHVMDDWRKAFDEAQRLHAMPSYGDAVHELNTTPDLQFLMMVRARWDALRNRAITWVVDDEG